MELLGIFRDLRIFWVKSSHFSRKTLVYLGGYHGMVVKRAFSRGQPWIF